MGNNPMLEEKMRSPNHLDAMSLDCAAHTGIIRYVNMSIHVNIYDKVTSVLFLGN